MTQTEQHLVEQEGQRVYRPCPHCNQNFYAREIWPHRARCLQNPKVIARAEKAARGPGKQVECIWCQSSVFYKLILPHLRDCALAPALNHFQRFCSKCQKPTAMDEFYKHSTRATGVTEICKGCVKKRSGDWYTGNRDRRRDTLYRKHYGITQEDYDSILAAQSGTCGICRHPPTGGPKNERLHVDHVHGTGKVRGLLCTKCNQGIGQFDDSPSLLDAAKAYLLRHHPELSQEVHTARLT